MFETICNMIELAQAAEDFEMMGEIHDLISHFAMTINCPSNWRSIGEFIAAKYRENGEIYDNFRLYDFDY